MMMHDPDTLAFEIRLPWFRSSRFPSGRVWNPWWKAGPTLLVVWHRDPQRGGSDDSCGWSFARPSEEEYAEVEKIAEFAWGEMWDEYLGTMRFDPVSVAVQLMTRMAWQVGYDGGRGRRRLKPRDLVWLLHFASNPVDSCIGSFDGGATRRHTSRSYGGRDMDEPGRNPPVFPADGSAPGDEAEARLRMVEIATEELRAPSPDEVGELREEFVRGARTLWRVYRTQHRPWWRHPRWHVHHWRLQVPPLQSLRRWLFDRCEGCGKRLSGSVSAVGGWNASRKGRHWWNGKKGLWHSKCLTEKRKAEGLEKEEQIRNPDRRAGLFYDGKLREERQAKGGP